MNLLNSKFLILIIFSLSGCITFTERSPNKICQDDYGLTPNSELLEQCIYDEKKKGDVVSEFVDSYLETQKMRQYYNYSQTITPIHQHSHDY